MPDSDSEFRNRVRMTDSGGETGERTFALDATPGDGGVRQRVERVAFEARALGREDDHHGLVRHVPTLAVRR